MYKFLTFISKFSDFLSNSKNSKLCFRILLEIIQNHIVMKTFIFSLIILFLTNYSFAQSFEKMNFPDITTTLSSSRSANFIDVNGDGWDDIFFTNGLSTGEKNMLYLNNGNGTFKIGRASCRERV